MDVLPYGWKFDGLTFITPIVKLISVNINFPDASVFPKEPRRELKSKWRSLKLPINV